jgi:predicted ATPase
LQVAGEVIAAYRDGVCFVDLGSVRDAALVPTSVAQAFDVPERTGKPLTAALCAHLRPLQLLLILDNCEHLPGACAQIREAAMRLDTALGQYSQRLPKSKLVSASHNLGTSI